MISKEAALEELEAKINAKEDELEKLKKERAWLEKQYLGVDAHITKAMARRAARLTW